MRVAAVVSINPSPLTYLGVSYTRMESWCILYVVERAMSMFQGWVIPELLRKGARNSKYRIYGSAILWSRAVNREARDRGNFRHSSPKCDVEELPELLPIANIAFATRLTESSVSVCAILEPRAASRGPFPSPLALRPPTPAIAEAKKSHPKSRFQPASQEERESQRRKRQETEPNSKRAGEQRQGFPARRVGIGRLGGRC
ncbi:hypothetical protein F4818DRAFT_174926 [Hypoxylon cercidicola]|nr:hypothetical protein F4818DRAFT_174926 [Hypoxylon cercidicola]